MSKTDFNIIKINQDIDLNNVKPYKNYINNDLSLEIKDPELYNYIKEEKDRQRRSLELIASENFVDKSVHDCLGSCLTNKYSEGYPGARYYGGTQYVDKIEVLCQERSLKAFNLDPSEWHVNVQPLSGSPANLAVYLAILPPHSRIMGLKLTDGGHLTHGHYIKQKKISASSIIFESYSYQVDQNSGLVNYSQLYEDAKRFCPKLIVSGGSAYPRAWDFKRLSEIAKEVGAYLLADISHVNGFISAELLEDPFKYADIVSTTTHKLLRGPRSALIFSNIKKNENMGKLIDFSIFPGIQGGPHQHQIAGVANQMLELLNREKWLSYTVQVIKNIKALSNRLKHYKFKIVTDGTDNHLILVDLKPFNISGSKYQDICDYADVTLNKNTIPGDKSPFLPNGVRIGSPAMTSRGCDEKDFEFIGDILYELVIVAQKLDEPDLKLTDFKEKFKNNNDLKEIKKKVNDFANNLYLPGYEL